MTKLNNIIMILVLYLKMMIKKEMKIMIVKLIKLKVMILK